MTEPFGFEYGHPHGDSEHDPEECGDCYAGDPPYFYLPHQCQDWEIGTPEDMLRFISEAQDCLARSGVKPEPEPCVCICSIHQLETGAPTDQHH